MSTADLTKATRELFDRTLVDQVFKRIPILDMMVDRRKITYTGGRFIEKLVDTAEIDDLVQEYTVNEPLIDQKKTTLEKPRFEWNYFQLPLRYDIDEFTQNVNAGHEEQLLNLAQHLVTKGQRGVQLFMDRKIFNDGTTTPVADGGGIFQSLISALNHDTAYGTIARTFSTGTNDFWQGADPSDLNQNISTSTQDDARNISVAQIRKWIHETDVSHHMKEPADLVIALAPVLFNKIRAEMETKVEYRPGPTQRQAVLNMELDGHTVVSVPSLQESSTKKNWVFILNLNFWELRIHTERNFKLTPFVWQGDVSNGFDGWLARIMTSGNFVCWKPNSSMWLSNVS